jgi:hypothetical protein
MYTGGRAKRLIAVLEERYCYGYSLEVFTLLIAARLRDQDISDFLETIP